MVNDHLDLGEPRSMWFRVGQAIWANLLSQMRRILKASSMAEWDGNGCPNCVYAGQPPNITQHLQLSKLLLIALDKIQQSNLVDEWVLLFGSYVFLGINCSERRVESPKAAKLPFGGPASSSLVQGLKRSRTF